jgi:hypothetical protein
MRATDFSMSPRRAWRMTDVLLAIAKERAEIAEAIRELEKPLLGPVFDGALLTKSGMADMDWDLP